MDNLLPVEDNLLTPSDHTVRVEIGFNPNTDCKPKQEDYFIPIHNSLADLQGGTKTERYHLAKIIYDALLAAPNAGVSNRYAVLSDLSIIEDIINDDLINLISTWSSQKIVDYFVAKIPGKGLSTEDYTSAEKNKLANIAPYATANSTDAYLLSRTNHTGVQDASTITENSTKRFVSDAEKTSWNNKLTKVQADGYYKDIAYVPSWTEITGKPTLFSGNYNDLTNKPVIPTSTQMNNWDTAYSWGNPAGVYAPIAHTHTFASITAKPTTLAGYGITDVASASSSGALSAVDWNIFNNKADATGASGYIQNQVAGPQALAGFNIQGNGTASQLTATSAIITPSITGLNSNAQLTFGGNDATILNYTTTAQAAFTVVAASAASNDIQEWRAGSGATVKVAGMSRSGLLTLNSINIATAPNTSSGTPDIITRNASGLLERIPYSTFALSAVSGNYVQKTGDTMSGMLNIQLGNGFTLLTGADNNATTLTNATSKISRWATPHYLNAQLPMSTIMAESNNISNIIRYGGGTTLSTMATNHQWYVAANNTTVGATAFMHLNSAGLGIGTSILAGKLNIEDESSNDPFIFYKYHDSQALAGGMFCSKARGTIASPQRVMTNDRLFSLIGRGYNGGAWNAYGAGVFAYAGEDYTSTTNNGTFVTIETTQNATGGRSEKLRVDGFGQITINSTQPSPAGTFNALGRSTQSGTVGQIVQLSSTGSGTQVMFNNSPTINSSLNLNGGASTNKEIAFSDATVQRWKIQSDTVNNFNIVRLNSSGTQVDIPFTISPTTGAISGTSLALTGSITASLGSFTGTAANTAALIAQIPQPTSAQFGLVANLGSPGNGGFRLFTGNDGSKVLGTWVNWSTINTRWESQATTTVGSQLQQFNIDGSIRFKTSPSAAVTSGNPIAFIDSFSITGDGRTYFNTLTDYTAQVNIRTATDTTKGIVVRANSVTQSGSLFETQNSTGLANFIVSAAGNVTAAGTITSNSTISAIGSVSVSANAGTSRRYNFLTGANRRWSIYSDATAESGSNAGSDFQISRANDAGVDIDAPFSINRATGIVSMINAALGTASTAVTQATSDNSTKVATTAFVKAAITAGGGSTPTLDQVLTAGGLSNKDASFGNISVLGSVTSAGAVFTNGASVGSGWNNSTNSLTPRSYVDAKLDNIKVYTASGNSSNAVVTIPHGVTGVTSASPVLVTSNNSVAPTIVYAQVDATNVYIFHVSPPATGTNNLQYSIFIKP